MGRGNTDLSSNEYDDYLSSRAKTNDGARKELEQRKKDKKFAHKSDGVGWHFGLGDKPVKVESREHLKAELNRRGLMLRTDVKRDLR